MSSERPVRVCIGLEILGSWAGVGSARTMLSVCVLLYELAVSESEIDANLNMQMFCI